MRLSFLKKCHKVRLLLAALCGLSFAPHLDAVKKDVVKTANDLKLLTAQVQREMTHPTAHLKKVKANYKQLRHAKIQAGNPEEAKSIREMIDTMGAAIQRAKAHGPENLKRSLSRLNALKSEKVTIDIVAGASTPKAAAAKPKPPKKPKKTKPAISPKPTPEKREAYRKKELKKAHAQAKAAKDKLTKIKAEEAQDTMIDQLKKQQALSPKHPAPTAPEPVAPEPDDMIPPATVPTTPKRPSADMLKEGRRKLNPTPKKAASSGKVSTAEAVFNQIEKRRQDIDNDDDDDQDDTTDGGWGDAD